MLIAQSSFLKKQWLWAILVFGIHSSVIASTSPSYFLCRRAMDVRTLRIQVLQDGSCIGWYTKEGLDQKVALSKDTPFCNEIIKKIRETLIGAGWKCKDISGARISY